MGIFDSIKDHFNNAEFTVSPNKKLKSISSDFKKSFGLSLVFYKGNMIAEPDLTMAALNKKVSKDITTKSDTELKIKASMKVGDVEKLFEKSFGVKVQIKNAKATSLIDNATTLGDAHRSDQS